MAQLAALGLSPGTWMKFAKRKNGQEKPVRLRGKRRDGQHRGHRCSATSRSGKKKAGR